MVHLVVSLLSLTITLCVCSEDKTHDMWLTRMEFGPADPDWIVNDTYALHKVNKNRKSLDRNVTLVQEINANNLLCEVKFYQKNGGKYGKGLFDIPKTPCCSLIDNDKMVWRCLQKKSNVPESCPIPAGDYQLKGMDPDECDYPKVFPPNIAEYYKVEFFGYEGPKQIFKHVGYATLKKRMQIL